MLLLALALSQARAGEVVGAAAGPEGPSSPICPMLPSPAAIDATLLFDRVVVHVDPTDAVVVNGLTLAGVDPHLVVPMAGWRDSIRWTRSGDIAAIVAEDPIRLAGDDLSGALRSGAQLRFGDPRLTTAVALPAPSPDWSLMAGPFDDTTWGVAVALRLPDSSVLELAGILTGSFAADPVCRDALVATLTAASPGAPDGEEAWIPGIWNPLT